jgi:DNA repair protein RadD
MADVKLWDHQVRGLNALWAIIDSGTPTKGICFSSPTGGGKTACSVEMLEECFRRGWRASFYTHRRLLLRQTSQVFERHGVKHGIRAADYEPNLSMPIQLSSTKTEIARVIKSKKWGIHAAKVVIIDELHVNAGDQMKKLIEEHRRADPKCIIIGLTATPIDVWDICDQLVVAGKNSELRQTTPPAHVWCRHVCPDEPDLRGLKRSAVGEFREGDMNKRFMVPVVFGRVYKHWRELNPTMRPTILFAPSLAGSRYFVDEFVKQGVPAAHIDGESIYWGEKDENGEQKLHYTTKPEDRDEVFAKLESGAIKVVCNRFVLVEGLDKPFIYHAIFACSYGSLAMWLQAGGRIVRGHPSLSEVIAQDHGANCRRHGWLNMDREWAVGQTWEDFVTKEGEPPSKPKENGEELPDPIICPKCYEFRLGGPVCPKCGHQATRSRIMVLQTNGRLRPYEQVYKPKKVNSDHPAIKEFKSLVFSTRKSKNERGMTFEQMLNRFKQQHPEYHLHQNIDKNRNSRYSVMVNGEPVPLPLVPAVTDSHMMCQRVNAVSQDDFKKLYGLPKQ